MSGAGPHSKSKLREKLWPAEVDFRLGLSNEKSEEKSNQKLLFRNRCRLISRGPVKNSK